MYKCLGYSEAQSLCRALEMIKCLKMLKSKCNIDIDYAFRVFEEDADYIEETSMNNKSEFIKILFGDTDIDEHQITEEENNKLHGLPMNMNDTFLYMLRIKHCVFIKFHKTFINDEDRMKKFCADVHNLIPKQLTWRDDCSHFEAYVPKDECINDGMVILSTDYEFISPHFVCRYFELLDYCKNELRKVGINIDDTIK